MRLGIGGLALAGLLGLWLVWPSPRRLVEVAIATAPMDDGSAPASTGTGHDSTFLPELTVRLDLPTSVLSGRHERLGLSIASDPASTAFTLAAGVVSADLRVDPPGESGQAYRPGAAFAWTVIAEHAPDASATMVLRARRSAADGSAQSERLLLARDLRLPVRTVAGLSAPLAAWAAASLALAGVLVLFVGRKSRKG